MISNELGRTLLIVGAACVFAVVYNLYLTRKWKSAAERLGLSYIHDDGDGQMRIWHAQLAYLSTIRGHFKHILKGTFQGRPVLVTEYTWKQGKARVSQTVACFTLSSAAPAFVLSPEGLGDKLFAAFGGQDIDFPDDEAFSSRFVLKGEEPRLRPYFTPTLRHRLAGVDGGWTIIGQGHELVVLKRARTASAGSLEEFIADTRRVADLFA